MTTAITAADYDYAADEINEEVKAQLEAAASSIHQLGRKSTEQAFELGRHLSDAADLLPEGAFGKWVAKRCGMTDRHARNFRAIHRSLSRYRQTLVQHAVNSTVLFKLASATDEQIEAAIDLCKETGSIKVKDVQAILAEATAGENAPAIDPYDVGGIEGLRALIADKVATGLKSFVGHLETLQSRIGAACTGRKVAKAKLADEIEALARITKAELKSLAYFVKPNPTTPGNICDVPFPIDSRWASVFAILDKLGAHAAWPESGKIGSWLRDEVLPALAWALSKTRNPEWTLEPVAAHSEPTSKAGAELDAAPIALREGAAEVAPARMIDLDVIRPAKKDGMRALPGLVPEDDIDPVGVVVGPEQLLEAGGPVMGMR